MNITYNTAEKQLKLPNYGRLVQSMIDRAMTITDRKQRQAYAEKIFSVMVLLNPQMRSTPNYKNICWNHLAFMSDYQLDVDYPCEIDREGEKKHINKLPYPNNKIRFRHYGLLLEKTVKKLSTMPADSPGRDKFISMTAARMKRNLNEWRGDNVENEKVGRDLALYTEGKVTEEETLRAMERNATQQRGVQGQIQGYRSYRRNRK